MSNTLRKEARTYVWDGPCACTDDAECFYHSGKRSALTLTPGLSPLAEPTVTPQGGLHSKTDLALHQLDPRLMLDLGALLHEGGSKYGRDNWKKISVEDHLNHALMHTFGFLAGDSQDDHLLHAITRLMFAYVVNRDTDLYRSSEGDK